MQWQVERGDGRQAAVRYSSQVYDSAKKVQGGCGFRIATCKQTRGGIDRLKVTSVVDERASRSFQGRATGFPESLHFRSSRAATRYQRRA